LHHRHGVKYFSFNISEKTFIQLSAYHAALLLQNFNRLTLVNPRLPPSWGFSPQTLGNIFWKKLLHQKNFNAPQYTVNKRKKARFSAGFFFYKENKIK
jgi:hypothetical protein